MNQAYADKEIEGILSSIRDTIEEEIKGTENKPPSSSKVLQMREISRSRSPFKSELKAPALSSREEVLDLTKMIRDDGTIIDIREKEKNLKFQENSLGFARKNKTEFSAEGLTSQKIFSESAEALANLAKTAKNLKSKHFSQSSSLSRTDALTVENLMRELLRPLLKDWLDAYLPSIVKLLVAEEVQRISLESQKLSSPRSSSSYTK